MRKTTVNQTVLLCLTGISCFQNPILSNFCLINNLLTNYCFIENEIRCEYEHIKTACQNDSPTLLGQPVKIVTELLFSSCVRVNSEGELLVCFFSSGLIKLDKAWKKHTIFFFFNFIIFPPLLLLIYAQNNTMRVL